MTDLELNIRAAKYLGFGYVQEHDWWIVPDQYVGVITGEGNNVVHDGFLKFTTSYDWSMIGVKEVFNKKRHGFMNTWCDGLVFFNTLLEMVYKDNKNTIEYKSFKRVMRRTFNPSQLFKVFTATPLQITQAWVEVLEAENE